MSSSFLTAGLFKIDYHTVMKPDEEIDDIIEYICNYLNKIKNQEHGGLKDFAEKSKLKQKNLSDFSNKYGRGSNPHFRTVYKALRTILNRTPIILEHVDINDIIILQIKRIRASDYVKTLDLFLEVFSNWEYASPAELAKVEGYLEMIRDRIIEVKDRPPAAPGALLSNSPET